MLCLERLQSKELEIRLKMQAFGESLVVSSSSSSYLASGQPLNFLGNTFLIGKIKFKLLFHLAEEEF